MTGDHVYSVSPSELQVQPDHIAEHQYVDLGRSELTLPALERLMFAIVLDNLDIPKSVREMTLNNFNRDKCYHYIHVSTVKNGR